MIHDEVADAPRITVGAWLEVLDHEYLRTYISEGGASVKVPVSDDPAARMAAWNQIKDAAEQQQYLVAEINSQSAKVHLAQEVFFRIAAQIPWAALAETVAADVIEEGTGYRVDDGDGSLAERIRAQYAMDSGPLRQVLTSGLQKSIYRDNAMARDFRLAMLPLCRDASGAFDGANDDSETILAWLTGQPMGVRMIKTYELHAKITRANATILFESLLHWIRKAGRRGLVILIDLDRLIETPPRPRGGGFYYTRPALLDGYEVLRQLIDATDRMEGCLAVAFANLGLLDEDPRGRGMAAYQALHYRLADEVRGRTVANPLSSLVRLAP